jgi:oligopeptidase B
MLDDTDFFKNYYISYEREKGLPQMRVTNLQTGESRRVEFPEPAYRDYPYINHEYDTTKFSYGYQSFIAPASVFEFELPSGTSTLLKQKRYPVTMTARDTR